MLINIERIEKLNCTSMWNPKYKIYFTDVAVDWDFYIWTTASNASFAYNITDRIINRDNVFADIHYTPKFKCIIDNLKIL